MEAEDWLKSIEKTLEIAQGTHQEKVLFVSHQLFGTAAEWWERIATLTRILVLSPRMSSKLDLELTTYLVVCSN
jgi:NADPH-dependent ferric siderophore reductase